MLQVSYVFLDERRKLKVYHKRVYMEQYVDIFKCTKPTIFLPASINLFKIITNKLGHCTNLLIPNIEQTRMETKGKSYNKVNSFNG